MKKVYIVYETDEWLTESSRLYAGVYPSKKSAVNAIVKYNRIDLHEFFDRETYEKTPKRKLEDEAKRILRKSFEVGFQTQKYSVNYEIEVCNMSFWNLR